MERRLSFSLPSEGDEPLLDSTPSVSSQAEEDHLASLIRAGIVTHRIDNPHTLDPLFAVSQLRDLPEVHFVAAFQHGLIVLGCPDGAPDSLADLVQPMDAPLGKPAPPSTAVEDKLDQLINRVDALPSQDSDPLAPLLAKMDAVATRLDYLVDGMTPDAPDAETPPAAPAEGVVLALSALQNQIETLSSKLEQPQPDAGLLDEIKAAIAAIPLPAQDIGVPQHTSDLTSQIAGVAAAIGNMQAGIADLQSHTSQTPGKEDPMTEAIELLNAKLDTLADAVRSPDTNTDALADVKAHIEALQQQMDSSGALASINARLDALHHQAAEVAAPITMLGNRLDGLSQTAKSEVSTLKTGLDALAEHLLAPRQDAVDLGPVLDALANLRADLVQPPQDTTSDTQDAEDATPDATLPRLDQSTQRQGAQTSSDLANTAKITAVMEALPVILQQAIETGLDLAPLHKTLAHLQSDLALVPDQLGTLTSQLAVLTERQAAKDAQLSSKLIELVEKLTVSPPQAGSDGPAFSSQRTLQSTNVSLEDIRYLFAELVASQIKKNTEPPMDDAGT